MVGAATQTEMLDGLVFDHAQWRVRGVCVDDTSRPLIVDVAAIERLVDAPPQLLVRAAGGSAQAPRIDAQHRRIDDLLDRAVVARDGTAGRIADVLVNTRHWALRYYVVDRGDSRALLHVRWTSDLDGGSGVLVASLPVDAIATAPAYGGLSTLTPGYQDCLYRHYTSRDFI